MELDTMRPFRGSDAVRRGQLTWGILPGPRFRRLDFDTYVDASVPDTPLLGVRAALTRAGPDAFATGWSACIALGLDVARGSKPVEIASSRRLYPGPATRARRRQVVDGELTVVDGTRTTTALRTAFDLATESGPRRDAVDRVVDPLTDAVVAADALAHLGGFAGDDLLALAARNGRRRGVSRVARVATLLDPRSDSPPETRARVKIVLAGLPRPDLQHRVVDWRGMWFLLDLAWPDHRVALEYDGRDHARADRRGRDLDRLDALRREGWYVIVVTSEQLARPRWVPDLVREALAARGWLGAANPWQPVLGENERWARWTPTRGCRS